MVCMDFFNQDIFKMDAYEVHILTSSQQYEKKRRRIN